MKRSLKIVFVLWGIVLGTAQSSHALIWHDSLSSRWPDAEVSIDGRATEWADYPVVEDKGMGFRAMNDGKYLYVLIRGTTNDGRLLLSGKFLQNVTLWFLKADRKTNAWGINLDFSRAQEPAPSAPPTLTSLGIEPQRVLPQGLEVSTTTFPEGFEFQADLSSQLGRQPIYEMRIPLEMLEPHGKTINFALVSSEVSPEVRAEIQSNRNGQHSEDVARSTTSAHGSAPSGGGGHHHHGMGGPQGGSGGSSSAIPIPQPIHLYFTISLAREPKH